MPWKQVHLLNDLWSISVDIAAISEGKLSYPWNLATYFAGYEIFMPPSYPERSGGGTVVLFWNSLYLKVKVVFLDPERRLVLLDVQQ